MERIHGKQLKDFINTFFRPENLMYAPKWVECPPGRRVLVLSPHFDDETLSCGGTLAKHAADGASVTVVFMTDGKAGDYLNPDKEAVMNIRKAEARAACDLLGIRKLVMLDEPETELKSHPALIRRLTVLFREERPDVVYLPTFLDNHIDHLNVNRVFADLLASLGEVDFTVNAYEGWTAIVPNLLVDITDVIDLKRSAIRKYASQLKYVDYEKGSVGLNAFRGAGYVGRERYAEGFLSLTAKQYMALFQSCSMKDVKYLDKRLKRRLASIKNTLLSRRIESKG